MIDVLLDPNSPVMWVFISSILAIAIIIMGRPFSTYIKFVYPNAKMEAIGNPYVQEKNLENLVESKNLEDFVEKINTKKEYNLVGVDVYNVHKSLDDNLIKTYSMLEKDSSKAMYKFYDAYMQKNDLHLIKTAVKNKLNDVESFDELIDQIKNRKNIEIINRINDVNKEEIGSVLKKYNYSEDIINSINFEDVDNLLIDTSFDKHFIINLKKVRVPYKCEKGKNRFIKTLIDTTNIGNVLRAKQQNYSVEDCKKLFIDEGHEIPLWKYNELCELEGVSQIISSLEGTSYYNYLKDNIEKYNQEKSTQVLEIALDSLLIKLVAEISMQNYISIGPTLRFLISKEFEIRNLKVISKGIYEKLPSDIIKDFLVLEAK